jgi:Sulfotransferase domain
MTLPNFLVIGAQRAGTTLLHGILQAHPEVFVPHRRKEIHFFDWYFDRGTAWYEKFFPDASSASNYKAIGEVTPDYLFDPAVPQRIKDTLPHCRFLTILRNPVDRAFSWYLFCLRSVAERRPVEQFLGEDETVLARGLYSEQLQRYFDLFPREGFLVLLLEELVQDSVTNFERIARFLELSDAWPNPAALMRDRVNASEIPRFRGAFARAQRVGEFFTRHDADWAVRLARKIGIPKLFGTSATRPSLPAPTRARLQEYYRSEICRLEQLLDRDLEVWRTERHGTAPSLADSAACRRL